MAQTGNPSASDSPIDSKSLGNLRYDWDTLPASSSYIRKTSWELRALPEELTRLPDDITVPEKLQEFLAWSLVPGTNWSFPPPPEAVVRSHTHSQGSKSNETREIAQSLPETDDEASKSVGSAVSASTSSFKTSVSELGPVTRAHSPDSEKSFKTKFLAKIKLGKSDGRSVSSDAKGPLKGMKDVVLTAECTSCFEDLPETQMTRLKSCRHWYCKECLRTLIVTAMAAEASFPPKCCLSPIPLQQILKALDASLREMYQNKAAEYAVPATDRWYCPNKDCLKWISKSKLRINRDLGYDCPHCSTKLCRTCRGPAHPTNSECPQDFGLEATLETAEIEGWQRCYKCRALVEHNTGCRHMTCRCKAEFCYVCGMRWLTCECTETDAANKRAEIQQRRQRRVAEVDAEAEAEAEEIARAIAEVEEMERLEAEQRLRDEERQQREEEEQLRLLEAERQAEEARRQEEAEEAEREFRRALVSSFEEELVQLSELLHKILRFQFEAISTRHAAEDARLGDMHLEGEAKAKQDFDADQEKLKRNSAKRHAQLSKKHMADTQTLESRQEEEEDDLFLQLQMRFKGKANRESRMERMMGEIHSKQEEEQKELQAKQKTETEQLDEKIALDLEGLKKWREHMVDETRHVQTMALQKFGFVVGADRQYFGIVAERRLNMLTQHGINSLASLEAGQDPIGLTEYEASKIEPYLPEFDDGEQGPSGTRQSQNAVMTPQSSSQVSPTNHPQQQPEHSAPIPALRLETTDLYNSHKTQVSRKPSQTRIPGAFPTDPTPVLTEPMQKKSIPHPPVRPPPPEPKARPPPIPKIPPPNPSLTVAPLIIRKSRNNSPSTSRNNSPPHPQRSPPPPQPQMQAVKPQAQPSPYYRGTSNIAIPAITMASLAAGMAMVSMPSQARPAASQDMNIKMATSSVTAISPTEPFNQDRRSSNASSSPSTLTAKKSKWNFMKPKDAREITEDEMKRKLRAAVGDAF